MKKKFPMEESFFEKRKKRKEGRGEGESNGEKKTKFDKI